MTESQKKFFITLLDTIRANLEEDKLDDVLALFTHGVSAAQAAISDNQESANAQ